ARGRLQGAARHRYAARARARRTRHERQGARGARRPQGARARGLIAGMSQMSEEAPATADEYAPAYGSAALAALGAWLLYVVTLAPTTAFWDTSEYIATAHIVGIPHPPGNSLFVVVAKVWTLLLAPLGLPIAVRVNLLAAT